MPTKQQQLSLESGHTALLITAIWVAGDHYVGHGQRSRQTYPGPAVGGQTAVYYSASHPWLSSLQTPTFLPGGLPVVVIAILFEFLFVMTIIDPKGKWALQTGLKEND
jgi:hypothetical protein